jgi:hypothetical protein
MKKNSNILALLVISILFSSQIIAFDSVTQYSNAYSEIMMEETVYKGMSKESNLGTNIAAATFTHLTPFMPLFHTVMTNYQGPEIRRRVNNKTFKRQTENAILALRKTKNNINLILNAEDQTIEENQILYQLMDKLAIALKNHTPVLDHYNLPYPYLRTMEFRMQSDHNVNINGAQEILILDREFFVRGMVYQAIGKEFPETITEKLSAFLAYCDALEKILMPYSGKTSFEKKYFSMNNIESSITNLTEARALIKAYFEGESLDENLGNSILVTAMRIHDPVPLRLDNVSSNLFQTEDYANDELSKHIKLDLESIDAEIQNKNPSQFSDNLEEYEYKNRHRWGYSDISGYYVGANPDKQVASVLSYSLFKESKSEYFYKKLKNFAYTPPAENLQILKLVLLCDQTLAQLYQMKKDQETK